MVFVCLPVKQAGNRPHRFQERPDVACPIFFYGSPQSSPVCVLAPSPPLCPSRSLGRNTVRPRLPLRLPLPAVFLQPVGHTHNPPNPWHPPWTYRTFEPIPEPLQETESYARAGPRRSHHRSSDEANP